MTSHIALAHTYWEELLAPGDAVLDATCGTGRDTLALLRILRRKGGDFRIMSLDIQEAALQRARALLASEEGWEKVELRLASHATLPLFPARLIVYNLGYLPGGNKALTTRVESTLQSVEAALALCPPGGALSLTCYPGHEEGARETEALQELLSRLASAEWCVSSHIHSNKPTAPRLFWIKKRDQKIFIF
jgi:SAM-dependent methyltransferase